MPNSRPARAQIPEQTKPNNNAKIVQSTILAICALLAIIIALIRCDNIVFINGFQVGLASLLIIPTFIWKSIDYIVMLYNSPYNLCGKITLILSVAVVSGSLVATTTLLALKADGIIAWPYYTVFCPIYLLIVALTAMYLFLSVSMWNPKFHSIQYAISFLVDLIAIIAFISLLLAKLSTTYSIKTVFLMIPAYGFNLSNIIAATFSAPIGFHAIIGNSLLLLTFCIFTMKIELNFGFSYLFFLFPAVLMISLFIHMSFYQPRSNRDNAKGRKL